MQLVGHAPRHHTCPQALRSARAIHQSCSTWFRLLVLGAEVQVWPTDGLEVDWREDVSLLHSSVSNYPVDGRKSMPRAQLGSDTLFCVASSGPE